LLTDPDDGTDARTQREDAVSYVIDEMLLGCTVQKQRELQAATVKYMVASEKHRSLALAALIALFTDATDGEKALHEVRARVWAGPRAGHV